MVCKSLLCLVFSSLSLAQSILWGAPRESFRYELLDDATLHDVEFVGQSGWAVGDHGTIRRTVDGGSTWKTDSAPESASLRSVCFLTNKIGWIAGGNIEPYTQAARGLVLFTNDGGEHWEQLGSNALPFLHSIRFFSLEDGIAVGSPLKKFGSGLLVTHDGGRSWEDVPGYGELNWRTGTFLSDQSGVVGGSQGSLAVLRGDRVITAKSSLLGNGIIHCMTLDRSLQGWMVGDEALLLKTFNGGVVWEGPKSSLPFELRGYVDFQSVAQREKHVWVAGKPGGTIWHSPDSGQSWEKQPTRNTLPIRTVKFRNENQGWAVGEMGLILRTENGGAVWEPVSGMNRRAAVMVIAARADQIPFAALARESGELGYRSVVVLPSEDRTASNSNSRARYDLELPAAVTQIGGNSAVLGTRLPVAVPGIQRDANLLIADWNARTDGRLQEVLIRGLVAEIRMWKPDVILLSAPAPDDFVTQILNQAVLQAVQQADDPTHQLILAQETHLFSWKVRRVCQHLPDSRLGDWTYPERQWLPHVGATLADLSRECESIAGIARDDDDVPQDSYQVLADLSGIPGQNRGGMFAGLTIPPGSESRRTMSPVTEEMLRTDVKLWEKRHNFSRIIRAELDQNRSAERTLAILDSHLSAFSPAKASEHLFDLSLRMIERGDWSAAEGFLIELVNRYPDQPAAQSGMKRLISFWASEEIAWQRSRSVTNSKSKYRVNSLAVAQLLNTPIQGNFSGEIYKLANASEAENSAGSRVHPLGTVPSEFGNPSRSPEFNSIQRISHSESEDTTTWRNEAYRNWLTQAGVLGVVLSRRNPNLFRSPEVQFALSAATRDPQRAADLQTLYADIHGLQRGTPAEWLQPPLVQNSKANVRSYFSKARPNLDGLLSEECWENADAIPLVRSDHDNVGANSLVMISHDAEYLYLAGTFPKEPGVKMEGPHPSGRKHDADLEGRDRLTVLFDTDRDHLTWYELSIDERGWTNESCWGNHGWNPEMYIATSADETHWRLEAAIKLKEFSPASLSGTSWRVAFTRTIPGHRWENWSEILEGLPEPRHFGVVQFE